MQKLKNSLTTLLFVGSVLLAAFALLFLGFRLFYRAAYPMDYAEAVVPLARAQGLDPHLVYAVIRTESGFRPDATSAVDARGLMQLTPDTYYWVRYRLGELGSGDPDILYDPQENIRYGVANLSLLLQRFENPREALAAYHAGWGSVTRWLEDSRYSCDGLNLDDIPFGDTNAYVNKVLRTAEIYKRLYPGQPYF